MKRLMKESFSVIGKEGSTHEGEGFIQRLWEDANGHFGEVAALAKKDSEGNLVGIWGAMSDESRSFLPWGDSFSNGLYLAGVECEDDVEPPEGWTKWTVPGFEYLVEENHGPDAFARGMEKLEEQGLALAGAVHDFTDPKTGDGYQYFPIRKL